MKGEFVSTLIRADSFWSETFLYVFLTIFLLISLLFFIKLAGKKVSSEKLVHLQQSGAAAAVDFVLTFPIFMVVLFLTIQFALVTIASIHVHYAAYSAAHSARVHYFDTSTDAVRSIKHAQDLLEQRFGIGFINLENALTFKKANESKAEQKAHDAAKMALIAVGSPKKDIVSIPNTGSNAWQGMDTYLPALAQQDGTSGTNVFRRKASYAFDDSNLTLDVDLDINVAQAIVGGLTGKNIFQVTEWPVKAEVTFKYILAVPLAGKILGTKGSHGFYYRDLHATISLL